MSDKPKRLYRSRNERMLAGVCGGLGEFFVIDPTLIRLGAVILTLVNPTVFLGYLILAVIIPLESSEDHGTILAPPPDTASEENPPQAE
jgi:phage shock protein C